jgi:uncharacterized protein (TIGR00251 family)
VVFPYERERLVRFSETENGLIIEVYVKPRSREPKILVEDDELVVYCVGEPLEGKVNKELVKMLSKILKVRVELVSGFSSRKKRLLLKDVEKSKVENWLKNL